MNELGYKYLYKGDTETAIDLFKLNTEAFPDAPNTWDSLAEGYMENKQYSLAEKYYKKSLDLYPENENAKVKLKKLEESVNNDL